MDSVKFGPAQELKLGPDQAVNFIYSGKVQDFERCVAKGGDNKIKEYSIFVHVCTYLREWEGKT